MIRDDIVGFIGLINSISNEGAGEKVKKKSVEGSMGLLSLDKNKMIQAQELARGSDRYLDHEKERSKSFRISLDSRRRNTYHKLQVCPTDTNFPLQSSIEFQSAKGPQVRSNLYDNYCEIMLKKHRRKIVKTLASNSTSDHGVSIELQLPCNRKTAVSSKLETTEVKPKRLTPIFDFMHIRKSGQVKAKRKVLDGDKKKPKAESIIDNLKSVDQKISLGLFRKTREKKVCKTEGNFLREQFHENAKRTKLDGWLFEEDKQYIGTENF